MRNRKMMSLATGVVILLLAAWLRLGAFHETLIGADQSSILAAAFDIAALRSFPLVGIKSSVGVMQTAITPYLAALPLLLVRRVIAVKWFFSVLDLLALALLYMAVKRTFGRTAASVAALLYATNPWVVEYVRWIWYQTLIPTFATTAFAAFLLCFAPLDPYGANPGAPGPARRSAGWITVGMVSAALMGMVHLAALPWTAALCVLALGIAARQHRWGGFLLGLGLSGLIVFPYAFYTLETNFLDVRLLLAESSSGGTAWNWATYRLAWELLTGVQVFATPRSTLWAESVVHIPSLYAVVPAALGLALAGGVGVCWKNAEKRSLWGYTLAWTVCAPTLFVVTPFHLQHFYLLFLFPAPYVLIGAWSQVCLTAPRGPIEKGLRWCGRLLGGLLVCLALWWTYIWTVRIGLEQQGLMRAPTRAWLMDIMAERIACYLEAEPAGSARGPARADASVTLLTTFDNAHLSPFDWVRNFVHSDRVRVVPAGQGFIIPADATCYLLAAGAGEADLWPVADRVTERADLYVPATPPWRGYCAPPRAALAQPVAEWENGLRLLEVAVTPDFAPDATLTLTYTWHYRAVAPRDYHFFNHILSGETLVAQVDGVGVPTWYWRDDDVLITRFQVHLPPLLEPGTYRLLTGSYTWPEVERVWLANGEAAYVVRQWEVQ